MNRTPNSKIRQILRREVGFGCPVPNCGNPYLEWHHFDPPWNVKEHHNPEGMIALCAKHHKKADAGAFTNEQLQKFKLEGKTNFKEIAGRFDWLRNKLLVAAGSSLYYETLIILQIGTKPIIWLRRDENEYLLVNFRMLTLSGEKRLILEDNNWIEQGCPSDFECPPSGKLIRAKYANGDMLKIEFFDVKSFQELKNKYPNIITESFDIEFPLTIVEVETHVEGADISFKASSTKLKNTTFKYGLFIKVGCVFELPYDSRLLDPDLHNYLKQFLLTHHNQ